MCASFAGKAAVDDTYIKAAPCHLLLKPKPAPATYKRKVVLSIDGGGMRGLVPARVLEEVEDAIKTTLWECHHGRHPGFEDQFEICSEDGATLLPGSDLKKEDIDIHLADYFDVISGTSTGAIVAAYLASKGGYSDTNILLDPKYKNMLKICQEHIMKNEPLVKGSAKAAQVLFVATGREIFTRGNAIWDHFSSAVYALPYVGGYLSSASQLLAQSYWDKGIDEVLQRTFGGGKFGSNSESLQQPKVTGDQNNPSKEVPGIKLSGASHDGQARLHTSLLIPTFQIELNRAVMFWYGHAPTAEHKLWGYSTINRLRPPTPLPGRRPSPTAHTANFLARPVAVPNGIAAGSSNEPQAAPPPPAPRLSPAGVVSTYIADGHVIKRSLVTDDSPDAATFHLEQDDNVLHVYNVDFPLWSIVRASTAAPTYFPPAKVASLGVGRSTKPIYLDDHAQRPYPLLQGSFADGGVVANNPTLAAIAFIEKTANCDPRDIAVLSLGCGTLVKTLKVGLGGGAAAWALSLVDVMTGASVDAVTAVGEQMFKGACDAVDANTSNTSSKSTPVDNFLRLQAVAFSKDATITSNCLYTPTKLNDMDESDATANYLAIDTSTGDGNAQKLADVLGRLDQPNDWQDLLKIGDMMSEHFKEDIRRWVKRYIFGLDNVLPV